MSENLSLFLRVCGVQRYELRKDPLDKRAARLQSSKYWALQGFGCSRGAVEGHHCSG